MFIPVLLAARGPITALTILVSTATFSAGAFFIALRNTALDCPRHSATNAACGVDILTDLVTFIAAAGATVGATFIGLTTPTPRDSPVFRVDLNTKMSAEIITAVAYRLSARREEVPQMSH